MCTVSIFIKNNEVIITSNRDEQASRPLALAPKKENYNNKNILFPKDQKGGGTWFATDETGNVVVLLNGAFEQYIPEKIYRKSRGLIVMEIISHKNPIAFVEEIDLENIAPFTIIIWTNTQKLYEFIWDGLKKLIQILSKEKAHIYSSVTLYDEKARTLRKEWFESFIQKNKNLTPDLIRNFHTYTNKNDKENGLIINRDEKVKTYSVTQVIVNETITSMLHHDLLLKKQYYEEFKTIFS
ncbi:MAG: hypothetical protein EAZ44_00995 [Cytophagia bacterium]|nr:MAG: hypothetical protein EAZ44_00995 [Cytophagia bacterium]